MEAGELPLEMQIDHQMDVDMFPADDIPEDFEDLDNDVTTAVAPFGKSRTETVPTPAIIRSSTAIGAEHGRKVSKDHLTNLIVREQSAKFRNPSSNDGREVLRKIQRERPKTSSCVRCVTRGQKETALEYQQKL